MDIKGLKRRADFGYKLWYILIISHTTKAPDIYLVLKVNRQNIPQAGQVRTGSYAQHVAQQACNL